MSIPFLIFPKQIFELIIFIILLNFSFSYLSFQYPYAFKLSNKNIFVIHQSGVAVCNPDFTEILSEQVSFSDSEKINTDESLSKITSVSEDDYIICLINDKIYIFDKEGYFKQKSDGLITYQNVEYYSLTYLYKKDDYILFCIGFISNDYKLYLKSHKYEINLNTIENILEFTRDNNIASKGISCQYMYNKYPISSSWFSRTYYKYLTTCVYYSNNKIYLDFFDINESEIQLFTEKTPISFSNDDGANYIRTVLLPNNQSLLIGWLGTTKVPYFIKIDVNNDNEFTVHHFIQTYCKYILHGFKIDYYPEKDWIMYTCIFESNEWTVPNANILVESLNTNVKQTNNTLNIIIVA